MLNYLAKKVSLSVSLSTHTHAKRVLFEGMFFLTPRMTSKWSNKIVISNSQNESIHPIQVEMSNRAQIVSGCEEKFFGVYFLEIMQRMLAGF